MVAVRAAAPLLALAVLPALAVLLPPAARAQPQPAGGEPPFVVRAELSRQDPWERSQVLYTVRIYRSSGSREYGRIRRLNDPILLRGEALIEQLGTDREYNFRSGDSESLVLERRYAIFPQSAGEMLLQPASMQWIGEEFGFRTRSFFPDTEPQRLSVQAVPSPPASAWLAASNVRLWDEFERAPNGLVAGEPMIRVLAARVEGQPARQIPELDPGDGPNFRHFIERPEYQDTVTGEGLVGLRRQRAALLALRGGDLVLPAVRLRWWNTNRERWETAEIPQRILQAQASPQPPAGEPADAPPPSVPMNAWLIPLLAGGWFATGLAWWISHRIRAIRRRRERFRLRLGRGSGGRRAAMRTQLAALANACRSNDAPAVERALLAWARACWEGGAPRNLVQLADRFGGPAATECRRLHAALYAPGGGSWDSAALLRAARRPPPVSPPPPPAPGKLPQLWPREARESG